VLLPALVGLDDAARRQILAGPRARFVRNEPVFHAGDPANSLHVLLSGHVSVEVTTPGGDQVTLAVLGPGATFGELALLRQTATRSATVRALDPAVTVILSKHRFEELRAESPDLDRFLVRLLGGYVERLETRLIDSLFVPVDKRVLRQLVVLSELYGDGGDGVIIPLTQDVIASTSGSTRPTTNQVLRRAVDEGLIAMSRGRILIVDAARLATRAR